MTDSIKERENMQVRTNRQVASPSAGNMKKQPRLANVQKLYYVPVQALREFLKNRAPNLRLEGLSQNELMAAADSVSSISETDIEKLYDDYRYGQNVAFYLYLLPFDLIEPSLDQLQDVLKTIQVSNPLDLFEEMAAGEEDLDEAPPQQITLLDEEKLNGIREIRFRYYVTHRFLNAQEQPAEVQQSRYGFVWLDPHLGYMVILSRDERVNYILTRALAECLQAIPVPARFAKELIDEHFSIEKAMRVSHYDPGTGVRQSISGHRMWETFEEEILSREHRYLRPSSLYEEEVADGVISGLGVSGGKGKIYFTKTLPMSMVRTWAVRRLPDLVQDVKALRASEPETFSRSTGAINQMRVSVAGKAAMIDIAEALLQAQRDERTSVPLPRPAHELYAALEGKYFAPYLRLQCSRCPEMAELCPYCESREIEVRESRAVCKNCGTVVSDGKVAVLRCMDGHRTSATWEDAYCIAPNHWLQKRIKRIFDEIGQAWDEQVDYFHIEGRTLHWLRKGEILEERLPPVIQNYIHNFWDPTGQLQGQMQALAVDPVARGNGPGTTPTLPAVIAGGKSHSTSAGPRIYHDFDLRIRGSLRRGYTVEATAADGGSVPPQALCFPGDKRFKAQLEGVLRQSTTPEDLQIVGEALFQSLFPARVSRLWSRVRGGLENGEGLRIRLHINPPELMIIPWELMYDEEFLGLRLSFPIVRYLDLPDPPKALAAKPPLRVLVAVSQPQDLQPLQVETELKSIRQALGQLTDRVEMDILSPVRRDDLLVHLRKGYHVLHYIGHGRFTKGQGYLILEDAKGRAEYVSAGLMGKMVADTDLRLVILNACETSMTSPNGSIGGVAHQLVSAGMSAVVAMQLAIPDRAATAFSREFYGALADGWPVDTAVQEGRRNITLALGNQWNQRIDWAIPTLYMRAPDGVIVGRG